MDKWSFDVSTSHHDAVKAGIIAQRWSRIHISKDAYPDWRHAAETAGCFAVAIHGGMPTAILPIF